MNKFAIVGCGKVAAHHAENILKIGTLIAVCDSDVARADAFAANYNAKPYYTLEEMLLAEKEVNIITVCTPSGFHAEHSIKALQSGRHVVCESPMCLTTSAAWQTIETEKFCRQKLFIVTEKPHYKLVHQAKKWISENRFGKIYQFQFYVCINKPKDFFTGWQGKLFPAGGSLFSEFTPHLNLMLYLFGDVTSINGFAGNRFDERSQIDDNGSISLQMESGTSGSFQWLVNSMVNEEDMELTIVAEKGVIRIGGAYLNEVRYQSVDPIITVDLENLDNKTSLNQYQHFYEQIEIALESKVSYSSALEALPVIQLIERIYKAVGLPSYHSV
ncbi:MAG: Gfo/Idh/MocA family oxidoreductase [Chitinophagaceae bacterium]